MAVMHVNDAVRDIFSNLFRSYKVKSAIELIIAIAIVLSVIRAGGKEAIPKLTVVDSQE
jgi:hypothetical protein